MSLTLVTGGAGFVGRQVVAKLLAERKNVRVVSRREIPGIKDVIKSQDIFAETAPFWRAAFEGVERVIHVAWYVEHGQFVTSAKNLDCVAGTLRMAKAAAEAGVKRFVGVGTCFEYDLTQGALTTETPLKPVTVYGAAKAATFQALSAAMPQMGVSFAWCRLFYLFGEGEDKRRLVPYLHECLSRGEFAKLSSGKQVRDFLDVREAAHRIVQASLSKAEGPLNICSGKPITVEELALQIADQYGRRDLLQFGYRPDNPDDPPYVVGVPSDIKVSDAL